VTETGERTLLRMHMSNFARWHAGPLYEALVERARRERLSGATVLAGFQGFVGAGPVLGGHPHAVQVERPVVVEIVDAEDRLQRFLAAVEPMLASHPVLVTLERAQVVRYGGAAS
jgi:uncharacterized protein